jgi:hypothetical protein
MLELEYSFFFIAEFFFPEFNIRLYDKNSESDFFFSSTKVRIFFSATLGIRIKNEYSNSWVVWKKNSYRNKKS